MKKYLALILCLITAYTHATSIQPTVQACDLVDHAEYADLLTTVKALSDKIKNIPSECLKGEAASVAQNAQNLQQSATKLHDYWTNSALVAHNAGDFSTTLQSAMTSFGSIAQGLKLGANNPACLADIGANGFVDLLGRASDVVMSLSPILVMGIAVAKVTVAAPVMPLLLSFSAAAVIIKTGVELYGKKIINLDTTEQRLLVLRNICDYQKLRRNVKFISFVDAGVEKVEEEQAKISAQLNEIEKKLPTELRKQIRKYKEAKNSYKADQQRLAVVKSALDMLDSILRRNETAAYQANVAHKYFSGNEIMTQLDFEKFDLSAVNNDKITAIGVSAKANYQAAATYKNIFNSEFAKPDNSKEKFENAQKAFLEWRRNLTALLGDLGLLVRLQSENLYIQMLNEDGFSEWVKATSDRENINDLLGKVTGLMRNRNNPSAVISLAELYKKVDEVHQLLVGNDSRSFKNWSGTTFAGEWLNSIASSYESSAWQFWKGYTEFVREINESARKSLIQKQKNDGTETGGPARAIIRTQNLDQLNGPFLPVAMGSTSEKSEMTEEDKIKNERWNNYCGRLSELYETWARGVTYFGSIEYFCSSLSDLRHASISDKIVDRCFGQNEMDQIKQQKSWVQKQKDGTSFLGRFMSQGNIVMKKMIEIKCKIPQRPN